MNAVVPLPEPPNVDGSTGSLAMLAPPLAGGTWDRYQAIQAERLVPAARRMLLLACLAILIFSVWDFTVDAESAPQAVAIRLIGAIVMFAVIQLSHRASPGRALNRFVLLLQLLGQATITVAATTLENGLLWAMPGMMLFPLVGPLFLTERRFALMAALMHVAIPMACLVIVQAPQLLWVHTSVFLGTAAMAGWLLHELLERVRRRSFLLEDQLARAATVDSLTGLANRGHFLEMGRRFLDRARRDRKPLSVLYLDLDHFKAVNDHHGHAVGDLALQSVVHAAIGQLRPGDLFGRLGGEEFAVVLPNCPLGPARRVAERLRQSVADMTGELPVSVTVSLGVAQSADDEDLDALLIRADEALLVAKRSGRNRVEAAPPRAHA